MLYFQSQDAELLELILYCFGYTLQMLGDNNKDFSGLYHQLSMLLETENDKIETATLYVLIYMITYLQYPQQLALINSIKLPSIVERIPKFGEVGRCYVVKFVNVIFGNSLSPSNDMYMYLEQLCKYVDNSVNYYIETAKLAADIVQNSIFSESPDQQLLIKLVETGE